MLVEQASALIGEAPPAAPEVTEGTAMAEPLGIAPNLNAGDGLPNTWAYPEEEFQPGSIRNAAEFWRDYLLKDPSISREDAAKMLGWVAQGVDVHAFMRKWSGSFMGKDYDTDTPPPFAARNHPMPDGAERMFATVEIERLIKSGAIARQDKAPTCVLPIGVVKGSKKLRLILDARYTNNWCRPEPMSYDSLRTYQRGIHHDDNLISLDFKSGYHHVALTEASSQYFGFKWKGKYYTFKVLPFGWNVAPCIFNALSTVVVTYFRRRGLHSLCYLDDFSFCLPRDWGQDKSQRWVRFVMAIMYLAGYTVEKSKSTLTPTRSLELLGLGIDTHLQRFWVPERKITTLLELIAEMRRGAVMPIYSLQRLVGKAQSLSLAIPPVGIFLKSSYEALALADRNGEYEITIPNEVAADLRCLTALKSWEVMSSWTQERRSVFRMETDAAMPAWGGVLYQNGETHMVGGPFKGRDAHLRIHIKELLAVQYSLEALGGLLRDCYLDLYTDNTIVQATLLYGTAKDPRMRAYSGQLLAFQLKSNVIVRVFRITTKDNVTSDGISRVKYPVNMPVDRNDHRLNPRLFRRLQSWYETPFTLDVCASGGNTQVPRFISRYPGDAIGCVAIDVFTFDFGSAEAREREFVYANPPWPVISALWAHLQQGGARGVMIIPNLPSKGWFGQLMRESKSVRRLASKGTAAVFFQPSRGYVSSVGPVPWDVLAVEFDFRAFADANVLRLSKTHPGTNRVRLLRNPADYATPPNGSGREASGRVPGKVEATEDTRPNLDTGRRDYDRVP